MAASTATSPPMVTCAIFISPLPRLFYTILSRTLTRPSTSARCHPTEPVPSFTRAGNRPAFSILHGRTAETN